MEARGLPRDTILTSSALVQRVVWREEHPGQSIAARLLGLHNWHCTLHCNSALSHVATCAS